MKWIKAVAILLIFIVVSSCEKISEFVFYHEPAPNQRYNEYIILTNNYDEPLCIYSIITNEEHVWTKVRFDGWLSKIVQPNNSSLEKRSISTDDILDVTGLGHHGYDYSLNPEDGTYVFIAIKLSTVLNHTPDEIDAQEMFDHIISCTREQMEQMKWTVSFGPVIE